jgi:hypothetical protein
MKSKANRVGIGVLLTLLSALAPASAWGWTFNVTANANFSDSQNPCKLDDGGSCSISSYINDGFGQPLTANDAFLARAFGNFNAGLPANQQWTIANGGVLPGTLTVSQFTTFDEDYNLYPLTGGIAITANYQPAAVGDPLTGVKWLWAQAINLNYQPPNNPGPITPITTMDVTTFSGLAGPGYAAPPLYPYQQWPGMWTGNNAGDGRFYDAPRDTDTVGATVFFNADDFLVTANAATDTLTVYQGFNYGWTFTCVPVPEPSTISLLGIGVLSMLARDWRRRSAKAWLKIDMGSSGVNGS